MPSHAPEYAMAKEIPEAVREVCLSFPESEEYLSHGSPNFRVRGKTYASYLVNHHGDGKVALWLGSPPGAQEQLVRDEPEYFFVPPYVGHRGWLGVELDKGLDWRRIAGLVREAYEKVAPASLAQQIGKTIVIARPKAKLADEERDPLSAPAVQRLLQPLREYCLSLPQASEDPRFGAPSWQAGKRTFATAYRYDGELSFSFWVGVEQQGLYTGDKRFFIPPYMGHNGWISLRVGSKPNWKEIRSLALHSYRHFALKRMLQQLE
jgi:predicted DNA-binding protein (MmcQ/YjbR family)